MLPRRVLLSVTVLLAACSGGGGGPDPVRGGKVSGQGGASNAAGDKSSPRKPRVKRPITFADCSAAPCMLHAGRGRYHSCLNAAAGQCFHYGSACTPSDPCVRDPATSGYRECRKSRDGECLEFGAACEPRDRCMIDSRDGVHRMCEDAQAGTCRRFGAPCVPKA